MSNRRTNLLTTRYASFESWNSKWFELENSKYLTLTLQDLQINRYLNSLFFKFKLPSTDVNIIRLNYNNVIIRTSVFIPFDNKLNYLYFNNDVYNNLIKYIYYLFKVKDKLLSFNHADIYLKNKKYFNKINKKNIFKSIKKLINTVTIYEKITYIIPFLFNYNFSQQFILNNSVKLRYNNFFSIVLSNINIKLFNVYSFYIKNNTANFLYLYKQVSNLICNNLYYNENSNYIHPVRSLFKPLFKKTMIESMNRYELDHGGSAKLKLSEYKNKINSNISNRDFESIKYINRNSENIFKNKIFFLFNLMDKNTLLNYFKYLNATKTKSYYNNKIKKKNYHVKQLKLINYIHLLKIIIFYKIGHISKGSFINKYFNKYNYYLKYLSEVFNFNVQLLDFIIESLIFDLKKIIIDKNQSIKSRYLFNKIEFKTEIFNIINNKSFFLDSIFYSNKYDNVIIKLFKNKYRYSYNSLKNKYNYKDINNKYNYYNKLNKSHKYLIKNNILEYNNIGINRKKLYFNEKSKYINLIKKKNLSLIKRLIKFKFKKKPIPFFNKFKYILPKLNNLNKTNIKKYDIFNSLNKINLKGLILKNLMYHMVINKKKLRFSLNYNKYKKQNIQIKEILNKLCYNFS